MRATHVRVLSRAMMGLIAVVLLAVLVNYLIAWRNRVRDAKKPPRILSSEMTRSVDRIELLDNRNGVLRFRIRAERLVETRLGKTLLQGIEACDFDSDGSVRNEIYSREAEYDRERGLADFSGDVRLLFGEVIELQTDSLHYDLNSGIAESADPLQFKSREAGGKARGVRFDQKRGSLEFQNEVDLFLFQNQEQPDGGVPLEKLHAVADKAYGSEQARRILLQGNVRVESASAELTGNSVEAVVADDGRRITSLTADGRASIRLREASENRRLSGSRIVFGIGAASQVLEKISALGEAEFASLSPAGEENLSGEEIHVELDAAKGLPTRIESRTGVRFRMKRGAGQTLVFAHRLSAQLAPGTKSFENLQVNGRARLSVEGAAGSPDQELRAEDIRMSFRQTAGEASLEELRASGSALWTLRPRPGSGGSSREPARSLQAALLELHYSGAGDFLESGRATGKVVMSATSGENTVQRAERRLFADEARFDFFAGNNRLKSIAANGRVRMAYEEKSVAGNSSGPGGFQTESEKMQAVFDLKGGESAIRSVSQWGSFRYSDTSRTAAAERSDYDAVKELLVLTGSPGITSEDMGTTTGERIEYDQKQKVLSVRKGVRSRLTGKEGLIFGASSSSPGMVTADELQYRVESGRARYTGSVHLLSEDGQLQAEALEIFKGGERVDAQGKIMHLVAVREATGQKPGESKDERNPAPEPMIIRSDALSYLKEIKTITYTGSVSLRSKSLNLTSARLDAVADSEGRRIERAKAQGNVRLRQGDRQCTGETADYYLDPGKFVVAGNPAEILEPGKGRSVARRLTSFVADDRILLEND